LLITSGSELGDIVVPNVWRICYRQTIAKISDPSEVKKHEYVDILCQTVRNSYGAIATGRVNLHRRMGEDKESFTLRKGYTKELIDLARLSAHEISVV
jgi:hypothetical protein